MLPLAGSLDGRAFTFQASLHGLALARRRLRRDRGRRRGRGSARCSSLEADARRGHRARRAGDADRLRRRCRCGSRSGAGRCSRAPARRSTTRSLRPATPDEVRAWLRARARRTARGWRSASSRWRRACRCALDAGGFDRHTFMCGQSGSGKTYSLGVMLEQLLLETAAVVVLDPNSDYVRMGEVRAGRRGAARRALPRRRRPGSPSTAPTRATRGCASASPSSSPPRRPRCSSCDPIADREEHAELDALLAEEQPPTPEAFLRLRRAPRRSGSRCASATSASTASASGRATIRARRSPRSHDPARAGSSSTSARCARATEQALTAAAVLGDAVARGARSAGRC